MKAARVAAYKDLSGFDFAASEINEATVRQLHRCEFMDGAQNVGIYLQAEVAVAARTRI